MRVRAALRRMDAAANRHDPDVIDGLAAAITEAAVAHDTTTNVWLLRPRDGMSTGPVLWVGVRPDATARESASISADLRGVRRKVEAQTMRLPVTLLVQSDDRLTPLGLDDPLGRVSRRSS
jgi:hypothetical protein